MKILKNFVNDDDDCPVWLLINIYVNEWMDQQPYSNIRIHTIYTYPYLSECMYWIYWASHLFIFGWKSLLKKNQLFMQSSFVHSNKILMTLNFVVVVVCCLLMCDKQQQQQVFVQKFFFDRNQIRQQKKVAMVVANINNNNRQTWMNEFFRYHYHQIRIGFFSN